MAVSMPGRYWSFFIFSGYSLLDLSINLLSNDVSAGLQGKTSVAQRIVLYVVMFTVAVGCSIVIEVFQKQHSPEGVTVSRSSYVVDIASVETQQLGQSTRDSIQLQALSQPVGITQPEALPRTEDRLPAEELPQTRVRPRPAEVVPEPEALPRTEDRLPADDLPPTEVRPPPAEGVPEPEALPRTEDRLPAEDLPQTEVRPGRRAEGVPEIETLPESGALSQTEAPSRALGNPKPEALPQTEVHPQPAGRVPESYRSVPPNTQRQSRMIVEESGESAQSSRDAQILGSKLKNPKFTQRPSKNPPTTIVQISKEDFRSQFDEIQMVRNQIGEGMNIGHIANREQWIEKLMPGPAHENAYGHFGAMI